MVVLGMVMVGMLILGMVMVGMIAVGMVTMCMVVVEDTLVLERVEVQVEVAGRVMVRLLAETGGSTSYWGLFCENVSDGSDVDEMEGLQESHI